MRQFTSLAVVLLFMVSFPTCAGQGEAHYKAGSHISEEVTLQDKNGAAHSLKKLISNSGQRLNVVFIFGGGGMGHAKTAESGGLWCPDSFADSQIFRDLVKQYAGELGFYAVAIPPVYHTQKLGFAERVFLDLRDDDANYRAARSAFVDSTEKAFASELIPVAPFYDMDFNFLISDEQIELRQSIYPAQPWHGSFRAKNETQHYGVPNLWLVDDAGKVMVEPFRGNVYGDDESDSSISYTLQDVVTAIEELTGKI